MCEKLHSRGKRVMKKMRSMNDVKISSPQLVHTYPTGDDTPQWKYPESTPGTVKILCGTWHCVPPSAPKWCPEQLG